MSSRIPNIETVLFDLDGTLLDTAPDLAHALNVLRHERNLPEMPVAEIKPAVGYGSQSMLKLALNIDNTHPDYPATLEAFFRIYDDCLALKTTFFPGMAEVLLYLEKNNIRWGIVTNKPARFTDTILAAMKLSTRSACTVSGDTLANRKPHPEPILHACRVLRVDPTKTIYVGDAATDIIASKAAGTFSLAALYGYINADEDPLKWNADGYIQKPDEIIEWIRD